MNSPSTGEVIAVYLIGLAVGFGCGLLVGWAWRQPKVAA